MEQEVRFIPLRNAFRFGLKVVHRLGKVCAHKGHFHQQAQLDNLSLYEIGRVEIWVN